MVVIPDYIKTLTPYKAGNQVDAKAYTSPFPYLINFASNENPLGPSPMAINAMIENMKELAQYPEPGSRKLIHKLAEHHKRDTDEIIATHGSESLITHIINAFADKDDEVLTAEATFVGIFVSTNKLGRKIKTVPLKNFGFDLEAIYNSINSKTRIIYLANINNPTGTMFSQVEFEEFIKKVPENILVVLDEAYYYYSHQQNGYPDGMNYSYPNLIVLRTFSKSHGLAGIRVGYGVGPKDIIGILYKVKLPFEPSLIAQSAALAAIDDEEFVDKVIKTNSVSLKMICNKFDEMGITYPEPKANFVMITFPESQAAAKYCAACYSRGILVRQTGGFGLPSSVRISTGTLSQTEYALKVFEEELTGIFNDYKQ